MPVIKKYIQDSVDRWNGHRMQGKNGARSPSGIPESFMHWVSYGSTYHFLNVCITKYKVNQNRHLSLTILV